MERARLFMNGRSQAVRLPKEFRFDDDEEVLIARVDDAVILFPRKKGWELMARAIERFTDDFMESRDQSDEPDQREAV